MFDKVSEAAERLAVHVSRRGFLGSLGRWAGATALAMAGVLSATGSARAGNGKTCCAYGNFNLSGGSCCGTVCVPLGAACPPPPNSCKNWFVNQMTSWTVTNCGNCKC
jgi:hypothetical protein